MVSDRDRCLSCPVSCCLSCPVCGVGVLCDQTTVGWIKMKLGMQVKQEVDLGAAWPHCVRCGPRSPSPKGHSPQFSAHICCDQMAGWIKMPLGMKVGLGRAQATLC